MAEIMDEGKKLWSWHKSSSEVQYSLLVKVDVWKWILIIYLINIAFSSSKVGQVEPSVYPVYVQNYATII